MTLCVKTSPAVYEAHQVPPTLFGASLAETIVPLADLAEWSGAELVREPGWGWQLVVMDCSTGDRHHALPTSWIIQHPSDPPQRPARFTVMPDADFKAMFKPL